MSLSNEIHCFSTKGEEGKEVHITAGLTNTVALCEEEVDHITTGISPDQELCQDCAAEFEKYDEPPRFLMQKIPDKGES